MPSDFIENGILFDSDEEETVSQEDYDFYWQDDMRKEAQIQADLQDFN